MTKENSNPPPASQHKKVPEPPELDEVFGKMEVLRANEIHSSDKNPLHAEADVHRRTDIYGDQGNDYGPGSDTDSNDAWGRHGGSDRPVDTTDTTPDDWSRIRSSYD